MNLCAQTKTTINNNNNTILPLYNYLTDASIESSVTTSIGSCTKLRKMSPTYLVTVLLTPIFALLGNSFIALRAILLMKTNKNNQTNNNKNIQTKTIK